jgi:hypothetical protein
VIENALAGTPRRVGRVGSAPDEQDRLQRALSEAEQAGVVAEAREGVALRALATGLPAAEVASAMGVVDVEAAEIARALADAARDRARSAADRARTEAVLR